MTETTTPPSDADEGQGQPKGIRVTVEDLATGDKETVEVVDDYLLLCAGSCYADGFQTYANGTHVVTIKGRQGRS